AQHLDRLALSFGRNDDRPCDSPDRDDSRDDVSTNGDICTRGGVPAHPDGIIHGVIDSADHPADGRPTAGPINQ
ncbi:MAG: hypothetical protein M3Y35_11850, partial [Actinomycetota bacterium]|nr:hypothetical protein [Actinomycetota bacterium]